MQSSGAVEVVFVILLAVVLVVMAAFLLLRRLLGGGAWCVYSPRLDGKVALVTGSTSGIGLSVASTLARLGATVVLANRSADRNRAAASELETSLRVHHPRIECVSLDLGDLRSVDACAEAVLQRHSTLDILVCNAAAMGAQHPQTAQGLEWHFGVNAFGHFRLVQRLLPALKAATASRVVFTSSLAHRTVHAVDFSAVTSPTPSDPQQSFQRYGMSKLAAALFVAELQRQHGADGRLIVLSADPGVARTRITEHSLPGWIHGLWNLLPIAANPEEAAQTVLHCALAPQQSLVPAGYYYSCHAVRPSSSALDITASRALWDWVIAHDSL